MNLARSSSSIDDVLSTLSGETFYYRPNPGNAGDGLIALATLQAFDRLGLRYRIVGDPREVPPGRVVVYGGGGNLVHYYSQASQFLERVHRQAKRLVVLSHTFEGHEPLLSSFGPNVELVCREPISFEYVKRVAGRCRISLSEDLALVLDVRDAMTHRASDFLPCPADPLLPYHAFRFEYKTRHYCRDYLAEDRRKASGTPRDAGDEPRTINCFRTDIEGTDVDHLPELQGRANFDASNVFTCKTPSGRAFARWCSYGLLHFLDRYDVINTNRLHVCVAGLHLNKTVRLYSNNYFKIKAIYEHSLEGRFPNLIWLG